MDDLLLPVFIYRNCYWGYEINTAAAKSAAGIHYAGGMRNSTQIA
jgi:hypothetical protein